MLSIQDARDTLNTFMCAQFTIIALKNWGIHTSLFSRSARLWASKILTKAQSIFCLILKTIVEANWSATCFCNNLCGTFFDTTAYQSTSLCAPVHLKSMMLEGIGSRTSCKDHLFPFFVQGCMPQLPPLLLLLCSLLLQACALALSATPWVI